MSPARSSVCCLARRLNKRLVTVNSRLDIYRSINPYSESQFRTLKHRHDFPDRFGSLEDARAFLGPFFTWYNGEHRHVGIGLLTPEMVYRGRGEEVRAERQVVLDAAHAAHPERFVRKRPEPPRLPTAIWINPPKEEPPTQ